ncbi:hypothetical protein [Rhodococcus sp. ACT016]|uniref:hypothetical protein n=1 Tax=Rhodococcus sp. ACT016 TaxID=3134808 RepID=UPI003D26F4DF
MSGYELLGSIAADIGGAAREALGEATAPIRIQVAGRAGVGRTTVVEVLERAGFGDVIETTPVDAPGAADPVLDGDVVVYVLSGAPRTPDVAALRRTSHGGTVALLNKADLLTSWAVALRIATECETETAVPTLPLVARAPGRGTPDGVSAATAAVAARVRIARARRARTVLATVAEAAARGTDRDVLESYLRSDEAVRLAALAAEARGDGVADRRRGDLARRRLHLRSLPDVPVDAR